MRILHHVSDTPDDLKSGVVVLGNFDGVHRGHQEVIGQAAEKADAAGAPLLVVTFEPHPRRYFAPNEPPFRLTDLRNKAHHLAALGVDALVVLSFNAELAGMTAEAFVDDILVSGLGAGHVVVGYDFCFGKGRTGTPALIRDRGGIDVMTVDPRATHDGIIYSSTRIRDYLRRGNPGQAAALLGRPFEIEGRVEKGQQLGRTIGFPTANLDLGEYLRPAVGIYAVRCGVEAQDQSTVTWYNGAGYYGNRPTVDGTGELFEAFLFDFQGDLYGRYLRVALIEFIRPDKKFDGLDDLQKQIQHDCAVARRILQTRAAGG